MSGSLAHSPADVIRHLLIGLGLGTNPADGEAWPVYVSSEPDRPDSVITTYDTSGRLNGRTQVDGEVQEHHGIQIRVRDANPAAGFKKANEIAIALDETVYLDTVAIEDVVGTGVSRYLVWNVSRVSGIFSLGKDVETSKRNLFTINAVVSLRRTT